MFFDEEMIFLLRGVVFSVRDVVLLTRFVVFLIRLVVLLIGFVVLLIWIAMFLIKVAVRLVREAALLMKVAAALVVNAKSRTSFALAWSNPARVMPWFVLLREALAAVLLLTGYGEGQNQADAARAERIRPQPA